MSPETPPLDPVEQQNQQALTPQPSIAVPAPIGAQKLGRGHEEPSDIDEVEMPRAKLIQFTSTEAQAENKEDRRDPGSLIHSITKEVLGNIFIPVFKITSFVRWNPRKKDDPNFDPAFEPGALIFTTGDRKDPKVISGKNFGPNGEAPPVTKYMNFLCYFPGQTYPLLLSFAKTSLKAGARLNTLTQMVGGDMFAYKYRLSVKFKDEAGTKYFVMDVLPAGKTSPEEFAIAESFYNRFHDKNIKAHVDEAEAPADKEKWPE